MSRLTDAASVLFGRANVVKEMSPALIVPSSDPRSVQPLSREEMIRNNPNMANIPSTWSLSMLPPGMPIAPITINDHDKELAETEPRSFQYYPAFNSNLTPRIYMGLMPFSLLKWYNETISEAALFRRLRISALTDFTPQIVNADGEVIQKAEVKYERDERGRIKRDALGKAVRTFTGRNEIEKYPDLGWLTTAPYPSSRQAVDIKRNYVWTESDGSTDKARWITKSDINPPLIKSGLYYKILKQSDLQYTESGDASNVSQEAVELYDLRWSVARPDRYNAFPQWLSRFMVNYIHYNAPAVYKIRDEHDRIVGLRVLDGSTIFAMIDVRGETPAPPAPAYSQIIWGTPKNWYNTYQLWYHPVPIRPDSPYGYTSVEDGKVYFDFLYEYWQWWQAQYNRRALPVGFFETPQGQAIDKAFEYTRMLQNEMQGNYGQQQVPYPLPPGWKLTDTKKVESNGQDYEQALKQAALISGVHPSEIGIVSGKGLTGSAGQAEKGEEAHARISVMPDRVMLESFFKDIMLEMSETDDRLQGASWHLAAPDVSINPQIEDEKWDKVWQFDGMTYNEYRDRKGLEPDDTDAGQKRYSEISGKVAGAVGQAAQANIPQQNTVAPSNFNATPVSDMAQALKFEEVTHSDDGGMVALFIPDQISQRLRGIMESISLPPDARIEDADNLHVTLAFFPDDSVTVEKSMILSAMQFAAIEVDYTSLVGRIGGYGVFVNGDEQVIYASLDAPDLPALRQALCDRLENGRVEYAKDHGFTPHITLAYLPADYSFAGITVPPIDVEIDGLTLAIGETSKITITFKEGYTRLGKRSAQQSNACLPDYRAFEKFWHVTDLLKHCGVCTEDDLYFGAPISRDVTVLFPRQGANETEIVALAPDGLEPRPALWKPEGGENERLTAAIGGPQYQREEAAYIVDRLLDFRLVPVAYVSEVDGERGAAIMYVRGNGPRQDVSKYDPIWIERAAVLDYVIGQCDRKTHNYFTHPQESDRPILFDNGLSFPVEPKMIGSVFADAWRGKALSSGVVNRLRRCLGAAEWHDISDCVGDDATAQAKARAQTLIDTGKMPE